ncbi:MAG: gfo/Idh/MocA family oxidoreductase [Acidobacteria bacterium]|nr:MAG: gfo/Idh/MocA family oxidoreductase [Acidobacteriota bacterium]
MEGTVKIALVGAGMFGADVHARAYADLERSGIAANLARVGLDAWARELAPVKFELVAIATRSEASARRASAQYRAWTGREPRAYWGERPWRDLLGDFPDLDVMAVATPDHLHTPVVLAALERGAHAITEKPMCLSIEEADRIVDASHAKGLIVAVDMHKRYDPDHTRIRAELSRRIGEPLYGLAFLEEPLEVSTRTFKWAEASDPFSYVGAHWTDLFYSYYRSKPVALTAVGQKKRLARASIDAYDAVQVRVDFANGMSVYFQNNWITPPDFEGPVNQGHEIVGTEGKIESDQQYRGLRYWYAGAGSRTENSHFTRDVRRPDGSSAYVGYGVDSITASLAAICRVKFFGEERRITTAIIDAARRVRDLNFRYLREGKGAPVSARFGDDGITIIDPNRIDEGAAAVFQKVYSRPI